ncbi:MAG: GNAT family N-acetyltransferase [Candidatus Eremiobacteraeota bacterium]|nr:GNAT family N-acetyltransferase [Candidatus Eremiobacteraeota bacterium]
MNAIEVMTVEQWRRFDATAPAPTFFARPAWACALSRAFPRFTPHPLRVRGRDAIFIVPLVRAAGGTLRWRELIGMPMGAYTCVLREDGSAANAAQTREALEIVARACDALVVTPWPLGATADLPAWRTSAHETAVVDMRQGLDAAIGRADGRARRMAGQALRRGVRCRRIHSTAAAVGAYYAMLEESAKRWGLARPPFPRTLLEAVLELGDGAAEVWLAECDGETIAGGVVLYGSQELFFWSAAMRAEYGRLRPSNALNFALLEAAAARGVAWYNLGASEGLPGVERFKLSLGASAVPYDELRHERTAFRMYDRLRTSLRHAPAAASAG